MIYKLEEENGYIEFEQNDIDTIEITIKESKSGKCLRVQINKKQIYDLIGVLHSIHGKMKKGVQNV